ARRDAGGGAGRSTAGGGAAKPADTLARVLLLGGGPLGPAARGALRAHLPPPGAAGAAGRTLGRRRPRLRHGPAYPTLRALRAAGDCRGRLGGDAPGRAGPALPLRERGPARGRARSAAH